MMQFSIVEFFLFFAVLVLGITTVVMLACEVTVYILRHRKKHKHKYNYAGEYVDGNIYGEEWLCDCDEAKMIYYNKDRSVMLEVFYD